MGSRDPKITVCIPHWQVQAYIQPCLRSIRRHSAKYDLEVIVVDNGSRDESLDYLRSLEWIRLIERPDEVHTNWPRNVFTAWDRGVREAAGEFFVTMHSDVFVRRDGWLDPLLREIDLDPSIAAAGAWKLEIENPLYKWQKKALGYVADHVKTFLGRKMRKKAGWQRENYPRDYCAMYRRDAILRHDLTFCPIPVRGFSGGGHSIASQLWEAGHLLGMISVNEMDRSVYHVAHGTAALRPEKPLRHRRKQIQTEHKAARLLSQSWIKDLQQDETLDKGPATGVRRAAA